MTYELAKRLKDAGFPLQVAHQEAVLGKRLLDLMYAFDGISFYAPTLSELIEACREDVGVFKFNNKESNAWSKKLHNPDDPIYFTGSTPEEAVAKLWLELNKK